MDSDEETLLLVLVLIIKEKQKRRPRKRAAPMFSLTCNSGDFHNLYPRLKQDPSKFFNYLRMSRECFYELLELPKTRIQRQESVFKHTISAEERLVITLRYLAAGCSLTELPHSYQHGISTISGIVKDTCQQIYLTLREICLPELKKEDWLRIAHGFATNANFPNCLGAIDGKHILTMNKIDHKDFFTMTFWHFTKQMDKKNNLFFLGPPSTGKTMIMNSLVECHFNFCRLTGLISNSSFNFSGLLHTNACLMDECKLTDNQFEQWKLLASGLPMSTDVKYKDRCDVEGVILYTCSNYPREMYCNVPMSQEAVRSRTITYELKLRCPWYIKISPHIWVQCWG